MSTSGRKFDFEALRRDLLKGTPLAHDETVLEWKGYLEKGTVVGMGSYGDVHEGVWINIPQGVRTPPVVAIKLMRAPMCGSEKDRKKRMQKFIREAVVWQRLKHRNILQFAGILTTSDGSGRFGLVSLRMKYGSVIDFLQERERHGNDIYRIILEIARGAEYLHGLNIVHGDIKPENVLVDESGVTCLGDFGLSRILLDDGSLWRTSATHAKGTTRYLSPELLQAIQITHTYLSDVYAYSMTTLQILTRKMPFSHLPNDPQVLYAVVLKNERPTRPTEQLMTDGIWRMLTESWRRDPESRPSMAQIVKDLERQFLELVQFPNGTPLEMPDLAAEPCSVPNSIRTPVGILAEQPLSVAASRDSHISVFENRASESASHPNVRRNQSAPGASRCQPPSTPYSVADPSRVVSTAAMSAPGTSNDNYVPSISPPPSLPPAPNPGLISLAHSTTPPTVSLVMQAAAALLNTSETPTQPRIYRESSSSSVASEPARRRPSTTSSRQEIQTPTGSTAPLRPPPRRFATVPWVSPTPSYYRLNRPASSDRGWADDELSIEGPTYERSASSPYNLRPNASSYTATFHRNRSATPRMTVDNRLEDSETSRPASRLGPSPSVGTTSTLGRDPCSDTFPISSEIMSTANSYPREQVLQAFWNYRLGFDRVGPTMGWNNTPWPVLEPEYILEPESLTVLLIGSFILNPFHSHNISRRDRIEEGLRVWGGVLIQFHATGEDPRTSKGMACVVQILKELLLMEQTGVFEPQVLYPNSPQ